MSDEANPDEGTTAPADAPSGDGVEGSPGEEPAAAGSMSIGIVEMIGADDGPPPPPPPTAAGSINEEDEAKRKQKATGWVEHIEDADDVGPDQPIIGDDELKGEFPGEDTINSSEAYEKAFYLSRVVQTFYQGHHKRSFNFVKKLVETKPLGSQNRLFVSFRACLGHSCILMPWTPYRHCFMDP